MARGNSESHNRRRGKTTSKKSAAVKKDKMKQSWQNARQLYVDRLMFDTLLSGWLGVRKHSTSHRTDVVCNVPAPGVEVVPLPRSVQNHFWII